MSNAEYHAHPAISKSGLDDIHKSPAHYQYERRKPKERKTEFEFGTAFHTLLLEPDRFESDIIVCDASTRGTNIYKELDKANPDKPIIMRSEKTQIEGMKRSFENHKTVKGVLKDALIERSFFWIDEATGVECRSRPDIIFQTTEGPVLVDLKSTGKDAKEYGQTRASLSYRPHVQAAMYMHGYHMVTGIKPKEFLFIVVEKEEPFDLMTFACDDNFIRSGFEEMRRDLEVYAKCLKTDVWPGYPETVQILSMPQWY